MNSGAPPELQTSAQTCILCWLATVDADGQPNVSPKEIFTVFDSEHLVIANIALASVRNIAVNPRVCVSFVDVFVQDNRGQIPIYSCGVKQQAQNLRAQFSIPVLGLMLDKACSYVGRQVACWPNWRVLPHAHRHGLCQHSHQGGLLPHARGLCLARRSAASHVRAAASDAQRHRRRHNRVRAHSCAELPDLPRRNLGASAGALGPSC